MATPVSSAQEPEETCEIRMERMENLLILDILAERQRSAEKKTKKRNLFKTVGIVLKFLEILGGSVCIYLLRNYDLLYAYPPHLFTCLITTGGFIMISGILLLCSFTKHGNALGQECYFNLLGTVMYNVTAVVSIDLYMKFWMFLTTRVGLVFGALCVGMGLLYSVDTWVATRRKS